MKARSRVWLEPTLKEAWSKGYPATAICVQRFDDSLNSAIRITYRISLRSSSLLEPRYPLLRVVQRFVFFFLLLYKKKEKNVSSKLWKGVKITKWNNQNRGWEEGRTGAVVVGGPLQPHTPLNSKPPFSAYTVVHRGLIRGYVLMILPQVHLRKPCYDFYFL